MNERNKNDPNIPRTPSENDQRLERLVESCEEEGLGLEGNSRNAPTDQNASQTIDVKALHLAEQTRNTEYLKTYLTKQNVPEETLPVFLSTFETYQHLSCATELLYPLLSSFENDHNLQRTVLIAKLLSSEDVYQTVKTYQERFQSGFFIASVISRDLSSRFFPQNGTLSQDFFTRRVLEPAAKNYTTQLRKETVLKGAQTYYELGLHHPYLAAVSEAATLHIAERTATLLTLPEILAIIQDQHEKEQQRRLLCKIGAHAVSLAGTRGDEHTLVRAAQHYAKHL
ncbi:hypothetical protein D6783_01430 [Candidatus Woesearchaeota archaeon]|nr:MAG: hypothetical protein D6783_01430 [Candidatus Woesearchaeota archaeon]